MEGSTNFNLTEAVSEATSVIGSVINWTVDTVTQNPLLLVFFVTGLIGLGIGMLSRLKHV